MTKRLPAGLLLMSAGLLALGAVLHARAFERAAAAAAASSLPLFYANSMKALWLIDSVTMLVLAAVFVLGALRPAAASRAVILLLALVPAGTSALLYTFMGVFLPAHILLAAAVLAITAGASRTSEV